MFLSCHVSVSDWIHTLSSLNFKELLVWNRHDIWSLNVKGARTHNHLVRTQILNHVAKLILWILICAVHLTVCSYHVMYAFQSESSLCTCLNVKEVLAWNRHDIWSLSDCNGIRTHNHLVRKRTLNIQPKWL